MILFLRERGILFFSWYRAWMFYAILNPDDSRNCVGRISMEKVIFHIDVNSAYLSWSSLKALAEGEETDYRTVPCVVGGDESKRHGVVLAKSLPAKKYGIHTGESLFEARRKCPVLTILKPDFAAYVKMSRAMFRIFETYSPDIYQYSIDEAFLDMTGMESLLGPPEETAARLKNQIRDTLGFTVNVGISSNYLLAKMASDFEKPDKVHTLYPGEIREKMWPLPVGDLFSVGRRARRKLEKYGVKTIGDLAAMDRGMLSAELGVQGGVIWDYANGIESSPLVQREVKEKSYGSSITTSEDVESCQAACQLLLGLCETVGTRLRLDSMKAGTVSVQVTDYNFKKRSHQKSLGHSTDVTAEIYEAACSLMREMWNGTPVRLIGVSCGKAAVEEYEQLSLFTDEKSEKQKKLDRAMDSLKSRFGDGAVVRASLLKHSGRPGGMAKAKMEQKLERKGEQP